MVVQPGNLLKSHGLRFVTSSLDKKEQALNAEKERLLAQEKEDASVQIQDKEGGSVEVQEARVSLEDTLEVIEEKRDVNRTSQSPAYRIAASAASYLHSRATNLLALESATNLLALKSSKTEVSEDPAKGGRSTGNVDMLDNFDMMSGDMASFMANTESVTSVVAAEDKIKQAVADDLNSTSHSPCGWFVCDDDLSATRFFIIQVA